jgi:WD40 repeat protein
VGTGAALEPITVSNPRLGDVLADPDLRRLVVQVHGFSSDERGADKHDRIEIWDGQSRSLLTRLDDKLGEITELILSADGRLIAASGGGHCNTHYQGEAAHGFFSKRMEPGSPRRIQVWDSTSGERVAVLELDARIISVWAMAFSSDDRRLALSLGYQGVEVWDFVAGSRITCALGTAISPPTELTFSEAARSIAFSPDGGRVITGHQGGTIRIWDSATGVALQSARVHTREVTCVALTPDGRHVVAGAGDWTLRAWDTRAAGTLSRTAGSPYVLSHAERLFLAGDGKYLLCAWHHGLQLWNLTPDNPVVVVGQDSVNGLAACFSPDGRRLAYPTEAGDVRLLDTSGTGHATALGAADVREMTSGSQPRRASSLAWSPNGGQVAVGWGDGEMWVCDALNGAVVQRLPDQGAEVILVQYFPDGQQLLSASTGGRVVVWDVGRGEQLTSFRIPEWHHTRAVLSPDGSRLMVNCRDHFEVRTVPGGDVVFTTPLTSREVAEAAFSADGQRLMTLCRLVDRTPRHDETWLQVWDLKAGQCVATTEGFGDVRAVAAGKSRYPWQATGHGLETVIRSAATGDTVAWFPTPLRAITTFPSGRTWAGVHDDTLCLVTLEGDGGSLRRAMW